MLPTEDSDQINPPHSQFMGFFSWIIFGFLAGTLAKWIMPGKDRGGCLLTTVLGILGAAVGGWIGTQLGYGGVREFDLRNLGLAILGSTALLLAFRMLSGNRN